MVNGPPYLRAYLGAPIIDSDGNVLGSISAVDTVPRNFDEKDHLLLQQEAEHIIALMERRLKERSKKQMEEELSMRILEAEEEIRYKIGQEIHDGIAQTLTASHMFFEHLKQEMKEEEKERLSPCIQDIDENLQKVIEETRGVSHDLMAKQLQFGLREALENLFASFDGEKYPLKLDFEENLDIQHLKPIQKKNIYRIIQEILQNTLKHSNADFLLVQLFTKEGSLHIHTKENGSRCLEGGTVKVSQTILDRVYAMGGHLEFHGEEDVTYDIRIPIEEVEASFQRE